MDSIFHLELVTEWTSRFFQMSLPMNSRIALFPFHVSEGPSLVAKRSRCLFQIAKEWLPKSYRFDFEMLHGKWPAAVSRFCYEIVCVDARGRI